MHKLRRPRTKIERKQARFLIDLRLIAKTGMGDLHGRTRNLNESGMAATIAGDISLGDVVELQFHLPETSEPLSLRAEVRYRQGFQYGFKFAGPTQEQLQLIRSQIRDLPQETKV